MHVGVQGALESSLLEAFLKLVNPSTTTTPTFLRPGVVPGGKPASKAFMDRPLGVIERTDRTSCIGMRIGATLSATGHLVTVITEKL